MPAARVIFSVLLIFSTIHSFGARVVNDSLVRGLDCSKLRADTVLRSIDRAAFSPSFHLPIRNWGANLLGQCWALSLAQRRFFYFARTEVASARVSQKVRQYTLDLFRGSHRECGNSVFDGNERCSETTLPLKVFQVPEKSFGESALFWDVLAGGRDGRSIRTEIEAAQQFRFYDLGNLDLVAADNRTDRARNDQTMRAIARSVERGRMPLLILNFETATQHAVLVKSTAAAGNGRVLKVYDSNNPSVEMTVSYRGGLFFGDEIAAQLRPAAPLAPIGVTIRDEDQMDALEGALFEHYQAICRGLK